MNPGVIHVKFEPDESLIAKKELLELQISILNILKVLRNYSQIRKEELKTKIKLNQKIGEVLANLVKIKEELPKSQLPETMKRKTEIQEKVEENKVYSKDLEQELQRIKEKLRELE